MTHSLSIILAAGLFGSTSGVTLAQEAPNRDRSPPTSNPDVGEATTAKPNLSTEKFGEMAVQSEPGQPVLDSLTHVTRIAYQALKEQVEALQARVTELEARQTEIAAA